MPRTKIASPGFSLIEMAVLLVVIGLVVTTIIPVVISSGKKDFLIEQKRAVRNARNEVLGHYLNTGNCTKFPEFLSTHLEDRMHEELEYRNNNTAGPLTIVTPEGVKLPPVAFWVASRGQNRVADSCNSTAGKNEYSANTICLGFLESGPNVFFDDVVDYATVKAVDDLCGR